MLEGMLLFLSCSGAGSPLASDHYACVQVGVAWTLECGTRHIRTLSIHRLNPKKQQRNLRADSAVEVAVPDGLIKLGQRWCHRLRCHNVLS